MLTVARVVITFVIIYLIFTDSPLMDIVILFIIGALTDFLDGTLARKFGWTSEFGRKADMIADRFLLVGTVLAFVFAYGLEGRLDWLFGIQILFIMSRELISAPFAILAILSGKEIPHAVFIAKTTTFLQGFAIPFLILSLEYPILIYLSVPLSIAIAIIGTISGFTYISDIKKMDKKA